MIQYREYKDSTGRFTLEIYTFKTHTVVKLFNRDKEEFRMEYPYESLAMKGVINSILKMMNDEFYQHN